MLDHLNHISDLVLLAFRKITVQKTGGGYWLLLLLLADFRRVHTTGYWLLVVIARFG